MKEGGEPPTEEYTCHIQHTELFDTYDEWYDFFLKTDWS